MKGDVHDIGKNIVGVVLGCNDYEVIDLGVMVATETILDTAEREHVDVVGLSGLITPSLDHMVDVARELERRRIELPLLIGGATTSRQHTAVKIAPEYSNETVHVLDASRVTDVVSQLLDPPRRVALDVENRELQARLREQHAEKVQQAAAVARGGARRTGRACATTSCPRRRSPARATRRSRWRALVPYIDWQFFFHAWDLKGKFPAILDQPAARELYDDARARARRDRRATGLLQARGVYGFWPAHAEGDDVVVGDTRFCFIRQQADHGDGRPNRCLADFVAPAGDHLGAFAVSIHGADELADRLRGRARRLPGDHREGARRPPGRGVCRVAARAGAPRVVRARRAPARRRPRRRALPGHPAGVRLSGLPRSQREGASCSPCSTPRHTA